MQQTHLSIIKRNTSYLLFGTLVLLTICYPRISAADDYLDSIEAEADQTTVLQKAQKEHEKLKRLAPVAQGQNAQSKKAKAAPAPAVQKVAAADVSDRVVKQFESGLYKEFPGNYAVYTRLSDNDKKEVVAAYQSAGYSKGLIRYRTSLTLILKLASQ